MASPGQAGTSFQGIEASSAGNATHQDGCSKGKVCCGCGFGCACFLALFALVIWWPLYLLPLNFPETCSAYYAAGVEPESVSARKWCEEGAYFDFHSEINDQTVKVFYHCSGDAANPYILMGHGYPTSSFDYEPLAKNLSDSYYSCSVDLMGYGFSDKPRGPFKYSLFEQAEVLLHFVTKVVPSTSFMYMTHDMGDSVGFQFLSRYMAMEQPPFEIKHHLIMNGNVYLPLASLTGGQKLLLNKFWGPLIQRFGNHKLLGGAIKDLFNPPLSDAEIDEWITIQGYQEGNGIQHNLILYLDERAVNEDDWLDTLGRSPVPATLLWGLLDPIATEQVATYVWENHLKDRTSAPAAYFTVPEANHYILTDSWEVVANLTRHVYPSGNVDQVVI